MREFQTSKKDVIVNVAPLFASSWLALFYLLRENYNERRILVELDENVASIKRKIAERTDTN